MLRDVSFPHLLLFANIPRNHLVLRKSKHRAFVKIFPWQWEGEGVHVLQRYSKVEDRGKCVTFHLVSLQSQGHLPNQWVFLIGSIMSRSTIHLSSFSSFGLSVCGTLQTGVSTGSTLYFSMMSCIQSPYFSETIMKF